MPEEFFDRFADLGALQTEKKAILSIFHEIKSAQKELSQVGYSIDSAKNLQATTVAMKEFERVQERLIGVKQRLIDVQIKEERLRANRAKADLAELQLSEAQAKVKERLIALEERLAAAKEKNNQQLNLVDNSGKITEELRAQEEAEIQLAKSTQARATAQEELNAAMSSMSTNPRQVGGGVPAAAVDSRAIKQYKDDLESLTGTIAENEALQLIYRNELAAVNAEIIALDKSTSLAGKSTAGYQTQMQGLLSRQTQLKTASSDLNSVLKNQIIQENSAAGGLDQLKARYALLTKAVDQLSAAQLKSPIGQRLIAESKAVQTSVKAVEAETGRFQRNVGNYSNAITQAFSKGFSFLRQLAYIIPGLGIAGILNIVIQGFSSLFDSIFNGAKSINVFKENWKNLNTVMSEGNKEAGKQVSDMKVLKSVIEDTTLPMKDRIEAIKALKLEFPDLFKNVKDEILLNGKAEQSYRDLTEAILSEARAKAAKTKLDELEAKKLDLEFNRSKVIGTTAAEAGRVRTRILGGGGGAGGSLGQGGTGTQEVILTVAQQLKQVGARRDKALAEIEKANKAYTDEEKFLLQFVNKVDIAKVIEKKDEKKDKKAAKVEAKADETLKYEREVSKLRRQQRIDGDELVLEEARKGYEDQLRLAKTENEKRLVEEQRAATLPERLTVVSSIFIEKRKLLEDEARFETKQLAQKTKEEIAKEKGHAANIAIIRKNAAAEQILIEAKKYDAMLKLATSVDKQIEAETGKDARPSKLLELTGKSAKDFEELMKLMEGHFKDTLKDHLEHVRDIRKAWQDLGKQIGLTIQEVVGGAFDAQKNKIQHQIDEIERLKGVEIDRINATADTEEKKAAKIKILEAKAAAEKERLLQKQKQLDYQKAVFDRAIAVATIVQNVAIAVTKDLAGNKALIPFDIAMGVLQIIAILAKPIPRFFKGTKNSPAGPAEVAEHGAELAREPSGKIRLFKEHSIQNLAKGTEIFTAEATRNILNAVEDKKFAKVIVMDIQKEDNKEVVAELKELNKKKQSFVIHNEVGIETTLWYKQNMKH